jgi:hypothetical protein
VAAKRLKKKVAILGFAETLKLAPFNDPEFEIWGMNQLYLEIPKADRWFEMHGRDVLVPETNPDIDKRNPDHLEWLKKTEIPIYMQEHYPDIPASVKFPVDEIVAKYGVDMFTSTVCYMLTLAILEGFEEIHLFGISMAIKGEYERERPGVDAWVMFAKGMGIKVFLPPQCDILKKRGRYGYVEQDPLEKRMEARISELEEMKLKYKLAEEDGKVKKYQCIGAINYAQQTLNDRKDKMDDEEIAYHKNQVAEIEKMKATFEEQESQGLYADYQMVGAINDTKYYLRVWFDRVEY